MRSAMTICPNCGAGKHSQHYLCRGCWSVLSEVTRRRLWKKDALATLRLSELYEQCHDNVPLSEIGVSR